MGKSETSFIKEWKKMPILGRICYIIAIISLITTFLGMIISKTLGVIALAVYLISYRIAIYNDGSSAWDH